MCLKKSFTLLELLIVIVIIVILVGFAVPGLNKAKIRAWDREAKQMLTIIQDAEKTKRLQIDRYVSCTNTTDCNAQLGLDLPDTWAYIVITTIKFGHHHFCAEACNMRGLARCWHIREDYLEPEKCSCEGHNCNF